MTNAHYTQSVDSRKPFLYIFFMTVIYTPRDLIRQLGGGARAAEFFGVSRQAVSAWKLRAGRLPPDRYFEQQKKLMKAGIDAHPGIWFVDLRDKVVTKTAGGWRL